MRALTCLAICCSCLYARVASARAAQARGVALYWHCDDDAGFSWRDRQWQKGGSPRVTYDTSQRVHGRASLRVAGTPGQDLWVVSLTRPAQVDPTKGYVLHFWARTRRVKGRAEVRVLAHGPKRADRQYAPLGWVRLSSKTHYVLPADQDWTRHDVRIQNLPGGAARLFVYLAVNGDGVAWFDEVSIAEEGVRVPLGGKPALADADYAGVRLDDAQLPGNLLRNGGFEQGLRDWRATGQGATVKVEVVAGNHALRFDAKEFTSLHVHQRVRVDPRRRYRLSLRAHTESTGLVGYFFTHVLPFNKHRRPTGWVVADHAQEFTYVTGKTSGWVSREQEFALRPDADSVSVYLYVRDTIGTVWIDDVRVAPLPLGEGMP